MKAQTSLTQFLDFTLRRSGAARTKYVRDLKYNEYHPAKDYWKQLRDEIVKIHSNNKSLDTLDDLVHRVHDKKRRNYRETINLYKKFFKNKELSWFDPGKSFWSFNDQLVVNSNPELGLYINNKPHLIKLYFKGEKESITQHNIVSALSLMNSANFDRDIPEDFKTSVLNIKRNRIHTSNSVDDDLLLSLEGDAQQFIYLWNNV